MDRMVNGTTVMTDVEETELDGDGEYSVDGIAVTCRRCGHSVEVYGTEGPSLRRAGVMLREECPRKLTNWYVVGDDDEGEHQTFNEAEALENAVIG